MAFAAEKVWYWVNHTFQNTTNYNLSYSFQNTTYNNFNYIRIILESWIYIWKGKLSNNITKNLCRTINQHFKYKMLRWLSTRYHWHIELDLEWDNDA